MHNGRACGGLCTDLEESCIFAKVSVFCNKGVLGVGAVLNDFESR